MQKSPYKNWDIDWATMLGELFQYNINSYTNIFSYGG